MKKTVLILFCAILFTSCHTTSAQKEVLCEVKVPSEVGTGQQFQYKVITNAKAKILDTDFGKFDLVSGPSTSTSTSISVAGGKTEQKTEYSYVFVLSSNREGTLTIPGVSLSVDGKVMHTDAVVVKVVKSPKQLQKGEAPDETDNMFNFQFQWPDMDSFFGRRPSGKEDKIDYKDNISKDDMFVKATVSQSEAYKGEPVVVTYKLFIKKDVRNFEIARANYPATEAAWLEHLDLNYRDESSETVKGETYNVYTIKQTAVYPKKTGKITVPKLDLVLRVGVPAVVNSPFWGKMTTVRAKDFQLTSNEVHLKVKPLPNAMDDNKVDIVGHFDISANASKTEVYAERPVTIAVTISGNGNLHHVESEDIEINFPSEWDKMYPKVSQSVSAKGNLVSGSKTFKYTFIPHAAGEYYVPGAKFTYYDDETMTYKTVSAQDLRIVVKESANAPQQNDNSAIKNAKTYKI